MNRERERLLWSVLFCFFASSSLVMPLHAKGVVVVKAQTGKAHIAINGKSFLLKAPVRVQNGVHIVRLKKELFTALGVSYSEWDKNNTIYVQLTHGANKILLEIQKGRKEINVKSGNHTVSVTPSPTLEYPQVFVPLEPLYALLGFSVPAITETVVKKIVPATHNETVVPETTKSGTPPPLTEHPEEETKKEPKVEIPSESETKKETPTEVKKETIPEIETKKEMPADGSKTETPEEKTTNKTAEVPQNIIVPEETPSSPVKMKTSHVQFGYSFFSLQHIKHSNSGVKIELYYKLPSLKNVFVTLSYAAHRWTSDVPGAAQSSQLDAAIFSANVGYSLRKFIPSLRRLNNVFLTAGYSDYSFHYVTNTVTSPSAAKTHISGSSVGIAVQFFKRIDAEYQHYFLTFHFNGQTLHGGEQITFSLIPFTF